MNYSISDHLHMLADTSRIRAYSQALRNSITPDSVVVDIGAGIGTLTLLACQFGARKVFAIEPDDLIGAAAELVEANGFGDRVEYFQAISTKVDLPEKADVVVSDLRGSTPLFGLHLPSVIDARQRHLKRSGILIPSRDRIYVSAVCAPNIDGSLAPLSSWQLQGLDLSLLRCYVHNFVQSTRRKPELLLTELLDLGFLDYKSLETPDFSGSVNGIVKQDGIMHGLCLWFDTELIPGVGFSTANREDDDCIYGSLYLPWEEHHLIKKGWSIRIQLNAKLIGKDYQWEWSADVKSAQGSEDSFRMSQNSLLGIPMPMGRLEKRNPDQVFGISEEGRSVAFAMSLLQQQRNLGEIAKQLYDAFPARYSSYEEAFQNAGEVAERFGV